jgi:hypothetical protein
MKSHTLKSRFGVTLATLVACMPITALYAAPVRVVVSIENLAPVNSVSFAPLRFGFNNGTFDAFNEGSAASASIISVAEGGSGSAWFPAFAAADPTAVLGSIMGPLTPGQTRSSVSFDIDTAVNQFFTFGSMVIPSNDLFIGNDEADEYHLFDTAGNLLLNTIEVSGGEIWNAGSEAADPLNAAFIVGGTNANRTPENGVVGFSFSELSVFNGLTTAAGYTFSNAALANTTPIYRISFRSEAIPEPASFGMMSTALMGLVGWRRRKMAAVSAA